MKKSKLSLLCGLGTFVLASTLFYACQKDATNGNGVNELTSKPAPQSKMDAPTIQCGAATQTSINIVVTAGASGAPAGFSLQWMTLAAYQANGNH